MAVPANTADIQAFIKTGFGSLGAARYILLRVTDAQTAKAFLRTLEIASVAQTMGGTLSSVCQIGFTASGLRALALDDALFDGFAPEFLDGMAGDERRSHRLGDMGSSAPEHWSWGVGAREPHVLLTLFADEPAITGFEAGIIAAALASGCTLVACLSSSVLSQLEGGNRREPFGFADGISQPDLEWNAELSLDATKDRNYRNTLATGEVLLGHVNEYGFVTSYPRRGELGRNGTYLAYRQLAQDVTGFWQWVANQAGHTGAIAFAQSMVGRTIDGDPLPGLKTSPTLSGNDLRNAFLYNEDPDGRACPIGSHIRRTNPRSGDNPVGPRGFFRDILSSVGLAGTAKGDAIASTRFHRLLRRGRPYGATLPPRDAMQPDAPTTDTGLHFMCLNANLARQFEFVQGAWVASATFAGLSNEQDPLLGNREPFPAGVATDAFSYGDDDGCPKLATGLPRFVTVKGGAYFFLPGLTGLARILAG